MRYEVRLVRRAKEGVSPAAMCEIFSVSANGYRAWKRGGSPQRKRPTDALMSFEGQQ